MRHNKKQVKLGRTAAHRRALFRNQLTSLFVHGSLITTAAKAKEIKRRADIMIGWAKQGTLAARRRAARELFGHDALKALFERWGPSFSDRESGYTRTVRIGPRQGDAAELMLVEIIGATPEGAGEESAEAES